MTDQDTLRRALLDAVPPLKPPADRLDAIRRRVRRQRLMQATAVAAASVTAVGAAAGLFAVLGPGPDATGHTSLGAPPPSTVSASQDRRPGGVPDENPDAAMARLKAAIVTALPATAPDATVTGTVTAQHADTGTGPNRIFGYNLGLLFSANHRHGSLIISIELPRAGDDITCATQAAGPALASCRDLTGPHGEKIVSIPATGDGTSNGQRDRAVLVRVARTDGTVVTVAGDNATSLRASDPAGYGFNTTAYTGKLPPLTIEQVTALALDPTLTLYP